MPLALLPMPVGFWASGTNSWADTTEADERVVQWCVADTHFGKKPDTRDAPMMTTLSVAVGGVVCTAVGAIAAADGNLDLIERGGMVAATMAEMAVAEDTKLLAEAEAADNVDAKEAPTRQSHVTQVVEKVM